MEHRRKELKENEIASTEAFKSHVKELRKLNNRFLSYTKSTKRKMSAGERSNSSTRVIKIQSITCKI
jgi:hypothetical protein